MRGSLARVGTEETRQGSYLRMLGTDPVFRLDEGVGSNIWFDKVFFTSTNLFNIRQQIFVSLKARILTKIYFRYNVDIVKD